MKLMQGGAPEPPHRCFSFQFLIYAAQFVLTILCTLDYLTSTFGDFSLSFFEAAFFIPDPANLCSQAMRGHGCLLRLSECSMKGKMLSESSRIELKKEATKPA
jgi:hypothetical protein